MKYLHRTVYLLSLLLASTMASAASWQVDNGKSQLSFVSVKKNNIAEVHHFDWIAGSVSEAGDLALEIDLTSVNTGIEIRDSRMKEFFFEVDAYPTAALQARIDPAMIAELEAGQSNNLTVDAELDLHGQKQAVTMTLLVTKVSDSELLVVSNQPVILNVADYDLVKGLEKLRELAGLPSISQAVPVSFYLTLNAM
ncbi:YceI family protein [Methylophaga sp. OBS1]|uniref:YceI family protein n=1 Tax=Methylophaga sp. OBS1 TaxID=2991933 RepID=UPI002257DE81|nr:YceI family protein [Methylophaga sp. OBS1]MCX4190987.1 YceI family protein [Methylophaga sp. OBS1]MCX4192067.1 YceI family protein [Methylophaga sp. OBS1]